VNWIVVVSDFEWCVVSTEKWGGHAAALFPNPDPGAAAANDCCPSKPPPACCTSHEHAGVTKHTKSIPLTPRL